MDKTVILGEASEEESEGEDIELDNDDRYINRNFGPADIEIKTTVKKRNLNDDNNVSTNNDSFKVAQDSNQKGGPGGVFGSILLSTFSGNSTFAKIASYSPYNLLSSAENHSNTNTHAGARSTAHVSATNSMTSLDKTDAIKHNQSLSLLHRTLYAKNQQFKASLTHLYLHPFVKATNDLNTISQRLVNAQKCLQEIESSVIKMGREQENLDIDIKLIV